MEIKDRTICFLALIVAVIAIISVSYNMLAIKESENEVEEMKEEIVELKKDININTNSMGIMKEEIDMHAASIGIMVEMWETQTEFNKIVVDIFGWWDERTTKKQKVYLCTSLSVWDHIRGDVLLDAHIPFSWNALAT